MTTAKQLAAWTVTLSKKLGLGEVGEVEWTDVSWLAGTTAAPRTYRNSFDTILDEEFC